MPIELVLNTDSRKDRIQPSRALGQTSCQLGEPRLKGTGCGASGWRTQAHKCRPRAEATAAAVQTNRCCGSPAKNAQRCGAPNLDRPLPAAPAAPAQAPAGCQLSWNPAAGPQASAATAPQEADAVLIELGATGHHDQGAELIGAITLKSLNNLELGLRESWCRKNRLCPGLPAEEGGGQQRKSEERTA